MKGFTVVAYGATVALSAAAGWWAHDPVPQALVVERPAPVPSAPRIDVYAQPLIAVASDGNVTLRVEQQPLQWVLEQIAMQGGWIGLRDNAAPVAQQPVASAPVARAPATAETAAAGVISSCPETPPRQVDAVRVMRNIEAGSEAERFEGLMLARAADLMLPEQTLKTVYESGASERVQIAALEAYLALHAEHPDTLIAALQTAQYAPTPFVQREAQRRLAELQERQRLNALPPLADP